MAQQSLEANKKSKIYFFKKTRLTSKEKAYIERQRRGR
jgi:hypothetical protein